MRFKKKLGLFGAATILLLSSVQIIKPLERVSREEQTKSDADSNIKSKIKSIINMEDKEISQEQKKSIENIPKTAEQVLDEEIKTKNFVDPDQKQLTLPELKLARLINDYRQEKGLSRLPISYALTKTARIHTRDSFENKPYEEKDVRGIQANLHSWSDKGNWTPVAYTEDHQYAESMWSKPEEIAGYPDDGFEISVIQEGGVLYPKETLESWKGSPGNNNVIIEADNFKNLEKEFQAMGVSIQKNFSHVWFGYTKDTENFNEDTGYLK